MSAIFKDGVYIIVGNHDIWGKTNNEVNSLKSIKDPNPSLLRIKIPPQPRIKIPAPKKQIQNNLYDKSFLSISSLKKSKFMNEDDPIWNSCMDCNYYEKCASCSKSAVLRMPSVVEKKDDVSWMCCMECTVVDWNKKYTSCVKCGIDGYNFRIAGLPFSPFLD